MVEYNNYNLKFSDFSLWLKPGASNKNDIVSCVFTNGLLDFKTAQNITPAEFFRKETVKWLHNNYSYVKNSILTEEQRQKIKDNIAF